jgi:hypothetical protein
MSKARNREKEAVLYFFRILRSGTRMGKAGRQNPLSKEADKNARGEHFGGWSHCRPSALFRRDEISALQHSLPLRRRVGDQDCQS